jgi:tetratricopeptide (TPR) repeat protein
MAQTAQVLLSESLRGVEASIAAGHPDLALVRCQEIQALYPRALAVHRVLGEIYLALRKPREALGALDRALGGDPEDARACCARAIVHQMHGDSLAALAWYRRACDIRPDDAVLRSTYGELASHLGQPPYRPTPVGLARLYLRGGLYAHAIREWDLLVTEYPDLLEAQVGLAETLWRAQRTQAAAERCRRILANSPSCVKALLLQAVIAHDAGEETEASRLVQRAAELDPDQRIAQQVFADRFAAGDGALRRLVLGDEQGPLAQAIQRAGQPTGQLADGAGARRSTSRPVVRPLTGQLGSRVAANGGADRASLSRTSRPTSQPLPSLSSGRSAIPPGAHSAFSEAEYMIWGPDEEGKPAGGQATAQRPGTQPGQPGPASQPIVPPALSDQGAALDETEVRQAINWVHWLQAQGARVHPGALSPADSQSQSAPPLTASAAPQPSGPLPPPKPEDLRSMFAELAPDASASRRGVVEADVASTSNERAINPPGTQAHDGHEQPAEASETGSEWYEMPTEHDPNVIETAPRPAQPSWADSSAEPTARVEAVPPSTSARPDATIESLERQFASSGFQSFEPQPGSLAALAGQSPAPAEAPAQEAQEPPAEALPARDDYPARLERARELRREGRTEEALVEYRAILKNAPGLLDTLLDELREVVSDQPEHPDVHRLLGDARIRQGDYLGALESYNRAVALAPAND